MSGAVRVWCLLFLGPPIVFVGVTVATVLVVAAGMMGLAFVWALSGSGAALGALLGVVVASCGLLGLAAALVVRPWRWW